MKENDLMLSIHLWMVLLSTLNNIFLFDLVRHHDKSGALILL